MHFQLINLRYQRLICLPVNKFASKFKWQGALNMEQIFGFCVLYLNCRNLRTCLNLIEVFCELCRNYELLFFWNLTSESVFHEYGFSQTLCNRKAFKSQGVIEN